jgi:hypothetical protein
MALFHSLELRKSQPRITFARSFRWSGQKEISNAYRIARKKTTPAWSWPAIASSDPDLISTVLFCVIVLLVMLVVMLTFPGFGAVIEQYHGI